MKKFFSSILYVYIIFLMVSCATTGKLEYVGNKLVVYGYSVDQIPETCEKYKLFTNTVFSKSYYNPNFIIGRRIKSNLNKPVTVENLPSGIRKKKYNTHIR